MSLNNEKGVAPIIIVFLLLIIGSSSLIVYQNITRLNNPTPTNQNQSSSSAQIASPSATPQKTATQPAKSKKSSPSPTTSTQSNNTQSNNSTASNNGNNQDNSTNNNQNTNSSGNTTNQSADIGLELSSSNVDLTINSGSSAKAFDLKSTGATGFTLRGYPTSYGPGINWSVASGGIRNGQSIDVEVQVNDGINPGVYTGTGIVQNQSGQQVTIPVKVTVVRAATSRFVKITYPNGGENIKVGDKVNITWDGYDIDKCTLGYSFGEGSLNNIGDVTTTGSGSYSWTVNIGNTANNKVKIDALCYKTGVAQVHDQSDDFFTVNP